MKIITLGPFALNLEKATYWEVGGKVLDFYNGKGKEIIHCVFKSEELAERAFDQINDYAVQNQSEALDLTEWLETGVVDDE